MPPLVLTLCLCSAPGPGVIRGDYWQVTHANYQDWCEYSTLYVELPIEFVMLADFEMIRQLILDMEKRMNFEGIRLVYFRCEDSTWGWCEMRKNELWITTDKLRLESVWKRRTRGHRYVDTDSEPLGGIEWK